MDPEDDAAAARRFDLFDVPADYAAAPWRWFRLLRNHDPVHRNSEGGLLITRFEDVRAAWRDPTASVDKTAAFRRKFGEGGLFEHQTTGMLFRDPPDHDRLRAIVNPFFDAGSMQHLRPVIANTVARLLAEIEDGVPFDFVPRFAFRLTITVICRMLGVPEADGERIQQYGKRILYPLNPVVPGEAIAAGNQAVADFKSYLLPHLERVRAERDVDPQANILCALVAAERGGAEITENEMLHICIQALNGGHESTTNLLSMSLHVLLDEPQQLARFRALDGNASGIGVAIEELIRFISPIQLQGRRTTQPIRLSGQDIPAGTELVFGVAAANRDERQFPQADTLLLDRKPNPHLGFGAGVHMCIGRALARLEAATALPALLRAFPRIERAGDAVLSPGVRFRGLASLPLRAHRE